jgi:hypothetical protein
MQMTLAQASAHGLRHRRPLRTGVGHQECQTPPSKQRTFEVHCASLPQASTGFMLAHSLVVFWQVHDALMRPDLPRGTVTFLFTDIEGSTRPLRRLGPELYAEALAAHRQLLRDAFAAEGGVEIDTQGMGSGARSRATRPPGLSAGGRTAARSTKLSFCARMDRHLPRATKDRLRLHAGR